MATTATSRRPARSATVSGQPRNWLAEISKEAKPKPTAAVIYGPPGVGKSSMAAASPGCVFVIDDQEDGINTLKGSGIVRPDIPVLPPMSNWGDMLSALDALAEGEHEYRTLVMDAMGGFERLCHEEVCRREYRGEWGDRGFTSYQKGFETSLPDWRIMLNALDRLRTEKSMSIILLGHSRVKPHKNPVGDDYDRYIPDIHEKTWAVTNKWADIVLFCNFYVETSKEGGRTKGHGGQERVMYTEYHAAFEAKNRHGLPTEISMGRSGHEAWANLKSAIIEAKKGATS